MRCLAAVLLLGCVPEIREARAIQPNPAHGLASTEVLPISETLRVYTRDNDLPYSWQLQSSVRFAVVTHDMIRVHLAVALGAGLGFGIITFALAWIAIRAHRAKVLTGPQAMIGATAVIRSPLTVTGPAEAQAHGQVEIRGELWKARLITPANLPVGSAVLVRGVDGLTLLVEPCAH